MISTQQLHGRSALETLTRRLAAVAGSDRNQPLPRLEDLHSGVPGGGRWLGLRTVPTECIRGTASTRSSRARDFRPLDGRAPADWQSRWSRLRSANVDLAVLPPVQLVRAGGDYWVVDGHNRVALARERGQLWIDADVTELDLDRTNVASTSAKEN
jgi:hypothetical protein